MLPQVTGRIRGSTVLRSDANWSSLVPLFRGCGALLFNWEVARKSTTFYARIDRSQERLQLAVGCRRPGVRIERL